MKISVLGTEYDFAVSTEKEDTRLCDLGGYHDGYAKIIRIRDDYNENHPSSVQNWNEYKAQIRRHEVIHAFFYESGLTDYHSNEQLVDWIALQFPKMLKAFQETEAI